jgi:hypothetical protein
MARACLAIAAAPLQQQHPHSAAAPQQRPGSGGVVPAAAAAGLERREALLRQMTGHYSTALELLGKDVHSNSAVYICMYIYTH